MVLLILMALLMLFAGWPILAHFLEDADRYNQGTNLTGQVPSLDLTASGNMIDRDTPDSAKTRKGLKGDDYVLVFSDEFEGMSEVFPCVLVLTPASNLTEPQRRVEAFILVMTPTGKHVSLAALFDSRLMTRSAILQGGRQHPLRGYGRS